MCDGERKHPLILTSVSVQFKNFKKDKYNIKHIFCRTQLIVYEPHIQ